MQRPDAMQSFGGRARLRPPSTVETAAGPSSELLIEDSSALLTSVVSSWSSVHTQSTVSVSTPGMSVDDNVNGDNQTGTGSSATPSWTAMEPEVDDGQFYMNTSLNNAMGKNTHCRTMANFSRCHASHPTMTSPQHRNQCVGDAFKTETLYRRQGNNATATSQRQPPTRTTHNTQSNNNQAMPCHSATRKRKKPDKCSCMCRRPCKRIPSPSTRPKQKQSNTKRSVEIQEKISEDPEANSASIVGLNILNSRCCPPCVQARQKRSPAPPRPSPCPPGYMPCPTRCIPCIPCPASCMPCPPNCILCPSNCIPCPPNCMPCPCPSKPMCCCLPCCSPPPRSPPTAQAPAPAPAQAPAQAPARARPHAYTPSPDESFSPAEAKVIRAAEENAIIAAQEMAIAAAHAAEEKALADAAAAVFDDEDDDDDDDDEDNDDPCARCRPTPKKCRRPPSCVRKRPIRRKSKCKSDRSLPQVCSTDFAKADEGSTEKPRSSASARSKCKVSTSY